MGLPGQWRRRGAEQASQTVLCFDLRLRCFGLGDALPMGPRPHRVTITESRRDSFRLPDDIVSVYTKVLIR